MRIFSHEITAKEVVNMTKKLHSSNAPLGRCFYWIKRPFSHQIAHIMLTFRAGRYCLPKSMMMRKFAKLVCL